MSIRTSRKSACLKAKTAVMVPSGQSAVAQRSITEGEAITSTARPSAAETPAVVNCSPSMAAASSTSKLAGVALGEATAERRAERPGTPSRLPVVWSCSARCRMNRGLPPPRRTSSAAASSSTPNAAAASAGSSGSSATSSATERKLSSSTRRSEPTLVTTTSSRAG